MPITVRGPVLPKYVVNFSKGGKPVRREYPQKNPRSTREINNGNWTHTKYHTRPGFNDERHHTLSACATWCSLGRRSGGAPGSPSLIITRSHGQILRERVSINAGTGGGGQEGSCSPCRFLGEARGVKVPFKYKEYYMTVSFQGAFS